MSKTLSMSSLFIFGMSLKCSIPLDIRRCTLKGTMVNITVHSIAENSCLVNQKFVRHFECDRVCCHKTFRCRAPCVEAIIAFLCEALRDARYRQLCLRRFSYRRQDWDWDIGKVVKTVSAVELVRLVLGGRKKSRAFGGALEDGGDAGPSLTNAAPRLMYHTPTLHASKTIPS